MAVGLKPANASPDSTCRSCTRSQKALQTALQKCAACKSSSTLYCSEKCQKADRARHIPECQASKAAAAEEAARATAARNEKAKTKKAEKAAARKAEENLLAAHRVDPAPSLIVTSCPPTYPDTSQPSADNFPPELPAGYGMLPSFQDLLGSIQRENAYSAQIMADFQADPYLPSSAAIALLLPDSPPNAYLSSLPETELYRQLIDCYRLRVEDKYVYHMDLIGLYGGGDPLPDFIRFLDLAGRKRVVPEGWNAVQRQRVLALAQDAQGGSSIRHAVEKHDIVEKYKDGVMPFVLRELASRIYGERIID